MSLLTVVQDVCAVVGVQRPTTVFASITTNRTMFEMATLATEMAQRIAYDLREWRQMKTSTSFIGDGVKDPATGVVTGTSAFNLPANYQRMLLTAEVWRSTSTQQPMLFIPDYSEWLRRRAANEEDAWGEWTLQGNQMLIHPIMMGPVAEQPGPPVVPAVPGVLATFAYLDKNCVVLNGGGLGDRFVNDNDAFRLPERLLKLGMTWQWKAQKGSPYQEDLGTYSDALTMLMGSNKPSPIFAGRTPVSWNARVAVPWQAGWGRSP
ncbi:hypothetical protein EHM76_00100 [bacterium]|nr:MAG: hypothetical protein EHM76_00100 [bacterium]